MTVFFDGECSFCLRLANTVAPALERRGVAMRHLQDAGARELPGVGSDRLLDAMRVRSDEGVVSEGADAVVAIARRVWWLFPLAVFGRVPGAMPVLRAAYRWIARHRGCTDGRCRVR